MLPVAADHLAANDRQPTGGAGRRIPIFVVVPDLLTTCDTFSPGSSTSLDKLFEQVKSTHSWYLMIWCRVQPMGQEKLFQLFNHRYVAQLPQSSPLKKLGDIEQILAG